jgi:DNA-binding NtrC family response regulator
MRMTLTVLIVDDEVNFRENTAETLREIGYNAVGVGTLAEARQQLAAGVGDVVLLDVLLPDGSGLTLLEEAATQPDPPPIIVMTTDLNYEIGTDVVKNGALNFLPKPIRFARLQAALAEAADKVAIQQGFRQLNHVQVTDFVVGSSPAMLALLHKAQRAAQGPVTILLTGESGTGKEVFAKAIHELGPRREQAFVAIACPNLPEDMLESELFGFEKGAFTSANARKPGLIEVAHEGLLFLDEISSLPLHLQPKLLRVLEERKVRRLGGTRDIEVDVKLLAATNRDLGEMVAARQFRDDLYYRLNVVQLRLPPLRERIEDLPELIGFLLQRANAANGTHFSGVTPRALEALRAFDWPGNIRQLRNVLEQATITGDQDEIDLADLPPEILAARR